MTKDAIRAYWERFLSGLPEDSPYRVKHYETDGFGDSPEMADELGGLVRSGIKTATCSALWEWEVEGETLPEPGNVWIILDGAGKPMCIAETTEVTIRRYREVDADFAHAEGEGDRSLEYWRRAHRNFFTRLLPKIGKEFSEDMLLVCERFRVIHR